ncbi:hypothetical protein ACKVWC_001526 [Pyricularia oryzae]|uniref:Uncharacterized protein n=1 Tax=Pyricularia grisea TaxID=148305 RepID=A0ABQ8N5R2_PYRGI|nr:hypothetical protein MCOR33_010384 [Pyricularia grisea]KAI6364971.1 hypothetical protein MCOR31_007143 [Pyricularia oryzae]
MAHAAWFFNRDEGPCGCYCRVIDGRHCGHDSVTGLTGGLEAGEYQLVAGARVRASVRGGEGVSSY